MVHNERSPFPWCRWPRSVPRHRSLPRALVARDDIVRRCTGVFGVLVRWCTGAWILWSFLVVVTFQSAGFAPGTVYSWTVLHITAGPAFVLIYMYRMVVHVYRLVASYLCRFFVARTVFGHFTFCPADLPLFCSCPARGRLPWIYATHNGRITWVCWLPIIILFKLIHLFIGHIS